MPLQDHFRPPLSLRRHWHSVHNAWATFIASALNATLPEGYFAEPNVQFRIEIDVAAFEEPGIASVHPEAGWTPPSPSLTIPFVVVADVVEVQVFGSTGGPTLAGAIELVSPSNKDRPAQRDAFGSKCAAYLQAGIGIIVVDVVTDRGGDPHGELLARLGAADPDREGLHASAYRPVARDGRTELDIWREPLAVGMPLPTLPLWLRGGPCLPVDLEATCERTRREQRMADPG